MTDYRYGVIRTLDEALDAAAQAEAEGLLGWYPAACVVLARELKRWEEAHAEWLERSAPGVRVMRWIPVTERLPTHPYSVLGWVTKGGLVIPNERGMRDIVTYFPKTGRWHQPVDGGDAHVEVSHWMDLPPPPGGWEPGASSDDEDAPDAREDALRLAGAAGADPDPEVVAPGVNPVDALKPTPQPPSFADRIRKAQALLASVPLPTIETTAAEAELAEAMRSAFGVKGRDE